MVYEAYIPGYLALEERGKNDFAIMSYGDADLLFDLIYNCPEALLLYDRIYIDSDLFDGLYEIDPNSPFIEVELFKELVDLKIIRPLNSHKYIDLTAEGIFYYQNLCYAILDSFPNETHSFPDGTLYGDSWWYINGLIIEMETLASKRIRPFTWNPVINSWEKHIAEIMNSKMKFQNVVDSYVNSQKNEIEYELERNVIKDKVELEEQFKDIDKFNEIFKERILTKQGYETGLDCAINVFKYIIPDVPLVVDYYDEDTYINF